ncbi:hypothetical protein ACLB2K_053478 [Fragaria x ananassa]
MPSARFISPLARTVYATSAARHAINAVHLSYQRELSRSLARTVYATSAARHAINAVHLSYRRELSRSLVRTVYATNEDRSQVQSAEPRILPRPDPRSFPDSQSLPDSQSCPDSRSRLETAQQSLSLSPILICNPHVTPSPSPSPPLFSSASFLQPIKSPAICAFGSKPRSYFVRALHTMQNPEAISYLTQNQAAEIDEILMGPLGFSVDQLMELAGLSVATSIAEVYKPSEYNRVLAICGPGNNGGDGLVAARHLHHFGYKPFICYPNRTAKPLYTGLVTQVRNITGVILSVPFISLEDLPLDLSKDFDIVVDAMFGFSFHGAPRPPFDNLIQKLICINQYDQTRQKSSVVVSIDIPSGWQVEGDGGPEGIKPDMLVSLTAPKLCAKNFCGPHHFLGGRFVPPSIADKFKLRLPPYPCTSMCVEADPFDQFRQWFDDVVAAGLREPNAMALSTACKDGKPSSQMVLLKGFDKNGFVCLVAELFENPHASLLFYWDGLNRQVRVEGSVQKVSEEESNKYFHSRPRGSQIGAVVSKQGTIVSGRHVLYDQYKELEEKFSDGSLISKPKNWGGYRLKPEMFEFWQGQKSRLHDRLRYSPREINGQRVWKIERLAP